MLAVGLAAIGLMLSLTACGSSSESDEPEGKFQMKVVKATMKGLGACFKGGKFSKARYMQLLGREAPVPEDGYQGDYVIDVARRILEAEGETPLAMSEEERLAFFTRAGRDQMVAEQQRTLEA